jgi:transcriptional regulator with XRE-family HTH domain
MKERTADFGDKIHFLSLKYGNKELAEELGVSERTIYRWKNRADAPSSKAYKNAKRSIAVREGINRKTIQATETGESFKGLERTYDIVNFTQAVKNSDNVRLEEEDLSLIKNKIDRGENVTIYFNVEGVMGEQVDSDYFVFRGSSLRSFESSMYRQFRKFYNKYGSQPINVIGVE